MSDEYNTYTRLNRFEKKRKNTKAISIWGSLGGLFVLFLFGLFIFGGNDDEETAIGASEDEREHSEIEETDDSKVVNEEPDKDVDVTEEEADDPTKSKLDEETDMENESDEEGEIIEIESNDENVLKAYTQNWKPVGTNQTGEHEISWDDKSQDWQEMMRAVSVATNISRDDMIEWWVEGGGEQKVIATVSNQAETEIFRVYVSWIDNEGWQPTKVEQLKENDQKHRFEDGSKNIEEIQEEPEQTVDET